MSDWEKIKEHSAKLREKAAKKGEKLLALSNDDVISVYSGKAFACCCGCSGKHYFNSKYAEKAGKKRGYEIRAEEINDRMITRVLNILKKNVPLLEHDLDDTYFSITLGNRWYIAYLKV